MPLYPVSEASPELLELFHTKKEAVLAHCFEPEPGVFIAESAKVTERALKAGFIPMALLIDGEQPDPDAQALFPLSDQLPVYTASSQRFLEIAGYPMTRGLLCAFRRRSLPEVKQLLRKLTSPASEDLPGVLSGPASVELSGVLSDSVSNGFLDDFTDSQMDKYPPVLAAPGSLRIAVLDNINNPANVGSIFRNAAALNIDALILCEGCCDPLARRSLRVSMGTVFCLPWTLCKGSGPEVIHELRSHGFSNAALALTDRSVSISDPILREKQRLALFLGNEGNGLSQETIRACDYTVKIPMREGVDSLNVASASAVAFWALR